MSANVVDQRSTTSQTRLAVGLHAQCSADARQLTSIISGASAGRINPNEEPLESLSSRREKWVRMKARCTPGEGSWIRLEQGCSCHVETPVSPAGCLLFFQGRPRSVWSGHLATGVDPYPEIMTPDINRILRRKTRHPSNGGSMLGQRRRRSASIETTLGGCLFLYSFQVL